MTKTDIAQITHASSRSGRFRWKTLLATGAAALTGISSTSASGQVVNPTPEALGTKPIISPQDSNGVDLVTGKAEIAIPLLAFGKHGTGLSIALTMSTPSEGGGTSTKGVMAGYFGSNTLTWNDGGFISHEIGNVGVISGPSGSGMLQTNPYYAVTNPDGSKYNPSIGPGSAMIFSNGGVRDGRYDRGGNKLTHSMTLWALPPIKAEFPDGEIWEKFYEQVLISGNRASRLKFATSNKGYGLQFNYDTDTPGPTWAAPARILAYNKGQAYCDESLLTNCVDHTSAISYVDFIYDELSSSVKFVHKNKSDGRRIFFKKLGSFIQARIAKVDHPSFPGSDVSYEYAVASEEGNDPYYTEYVASASKAGGTWNYSYWRLMHEGRLIAESFLTRTGPGNETISARGNLTFGVVEELTDELGRVSAQGVGGARYRFAGHGLPEGNGVAYEYDLRGNITKVTSVAKAGSGLPNIVETATYPIDCENPKVCNRPLSVTDSRGNTTIYTYHAQSGMVATRTSPAVNGIAAVQRYIYEQRPAWMKNTSGGYSPAPTMIWLLSEERSCRTSATVGNACSAGASDEVVVNYQYEAGSASTPSNLLLKGTAVTADGQTLRTCFGYDAAGNRIWETKPRAGLATCA